MQIKATTFAMLAGMVYLAAGLLALVPAMLVPPPVDAPPTHFALLYGYLLGMFPVNIAQTALNIALGAWAFAAMRSEADARAFARVFAILMAILAILGMLPALNTLFGLMPLHGGDVALHALTAAASAYFAMREPTPQQERRHIPGDRRQRMLPVSRERRLGLADRREHLHGGMAPA